MKRNTRMIALIIVLIIAVSFSSSGIIQVFAHSTILDVDYDDCIASVDNDGIDEVWYVLREGSEHHPHLAQDTMTIKYKYINEVSTDLWEKLIPGADPQVLKDAYTNSMKKWNNVYFYSYNSDGTVTKRKVIDIVETVGEDYNLLIEIKLIAYDAAAVTKWSEEFCEAASECNDHKHCSNWEMVVDYRAFYEQGGITEHVNILRERDGAHEIGHVLGLCDVDKDNLCNAEGNVEDHHFEILMGYGEAINERVTNITYKDIAGVAITRGFHTDADHKWLYAGQQSDGTYKLICTICNGVEYADSLSGYTYDVYGSCGNNHILSSGNMIAVASYGTKDYYKCKYCRYVEEFRNNVEQNYVATTSIDSTQHECYNDVMGLTYTTYEAHSYIYRNRDSTTHTATCACGYEMILTHWIKESELTGGRYERCAACGARIDTGSSFVPVGPANIAQVSVNGSYILPNGIAVIVDADVEAYINGTLVFYNPDDLPVTQ